MRLLDQTKQAVHLQRTIFADMDERDAFYAGELAAIDPERIHTDTYERLNCGLLVNTGRNYVAKALRETSVAAGGNPDTTVRFIAANTYIGVGDSTTAAATAQTDLQAATNKFRKVMDTGFPKIQGETYCVDEATEILTSTGWKSYDALRVGDEVLTLNHVTGLSEWQPVRDVCVFDPMPRDMLSMEGQHHSSLTTLNHRWPIEKLHFRVAEPNNRRDPVSGRFIAGERNMDHRSKGRDRLWATSETLSKNDSLITAALSADLPQEAKWTDAFVEVLAWWWTEGHIWETKDGHVPGRSVISQSRKVNMPHVESIRRALTGMLGAECEKFTNPKYGRDPIPRWRERSKRGGEMAEFALNSTATDLLWSVAPDKVVSVDFLRQLTQAQLDLFIAKSVDADGSIDKRSSTDKGCVAQRDRDRSEAFLFACVLAGHPVSLREHPDDLGSMWHVNIKSKDRIWPVSSFKRKQYQKAGTGSFVMERVVHDGIVWCPVTTNETWLARRDGSVWFTGNSRANPTTGASETVTPTNGDFIARVTWAGTEVAYQHVEFAIFNASTGGTMLDRFIGGVASAYQGTKPTGTNQVWEETITLNFA